MFQIHVSSSDIVVLTVVFHIVTLLDAAGTSASPMGHGQFDEHGNMQPFSRPASAARPIVRTSVHAG